MLRVSPVHGSIGTALLALGLAACNGPAFSRNTALDRDTHDPNFPINAGKHAALDCNDCHGEFDSFRDFTCIGCHDGAHDQDKTDPPHLGLTGYQYARVSCYGCHPRGQILEDAFHDRFFPVGTTSPHTGLECGQCHPIEGKRKQYTCTDCHSHSPAETDALHVAVADYRYADAECYHCHPDGNGLPRESHTDFFPIAEASAHAQVACAECHSTPGDRTVVDCIDCHSHERDPTGSAHELVGGYEYRSDLCLRCHFDSMVDRVSDHRPFRIEGGPHGPDHAPCLRCHLDARSDRTWAADWVSFDCRPCHDCASMDRRHRGRAGYECVSTTCVQSGCHPAGRKGGD